MATEFIQKVVEATGGKDRSISWFQNKIREFGSPTSAQLIREGKRRSTPFFGKLNMFFYSPKYKDKLPYYDRFPLVLPLESFRGGFLGINLYNFVETQYRRIDADEFVVATSLPVQRFTKATSRKVWRDSRSMV